MSIIQKDWLRRQWQRVAAKEVEEASTLEKTRALLRVFSPETAAAIDNGEVAFGYSRFITGWAAAEFRPAYLFDKPAMLFHPLACADPQKMIVGAMHEGVHFWQYKHLGLTSTIRKLLAPRSSLLLTRMIEGGAYTYAGGMRAVVASNAARRGKVPVSPPDLQDDPRDAGERFLRRQRRLDDNYDLATLAQSTVLFPFNSRVMPMDEMRRILHVRPDAASPRYLDDMDDRTLENALLEHVAPRIRKVIDLMEDYREAAAAGAFSPAGRLKMLVQVNRAANAALKP